MSAPAAQPVRLLIVDDSPLIRAGLRAVLEGCDSVSIVGEAGSAAEALEQVSRLKPGVVLLDLRLPDRSGLEACRDILAARPDTRVLILTSTDDQRMVREAIAVGAHGYLLKENDGASLVSAITRVAAGHSVLDPSLADQILSLVKSPSVQEPAGRLAALSPQERRVLALLAEGKTNKEIAAALDLSDKTVRNYLSNLFDKLQVERRAHAAALFARAADERPDTGNPRR